MQQFYDWYVPQTLRKTSERPFNSTTKYKSSFFSPELLRALREDSDAQAKVSDDIVGIDFDPFLSSQDPCQHNVVGNITQQEDSYLAEVSAVCSGKKRRNPDVVPELIFKDGQWIFVNFHYPSEKQQENSNLLAVLKTLREDRGKIP